MPFGEFVREFYLSGKVAMKKNLSFRFLWSGTAIVLSCAFIFAKAASTQEFINVAKYNTLNEAINAAVLEGKHGVYIPPNHVISANSVSIPNNFTLAGGDKRTSIVKFTGLTNYDGFTATDTSPSGICFDTFSIDACSISAPSGTEYNNSGIIKMVKAKNITVKNIRFMNAPRHALYLNGNDNLIENCEILDSNFVCIGIEGKNNCVRRNEIYGGTDWYGIRASGSNNYITGNHISQLGANATGIRIVGLANSLVKDNIIEYVGHFGIFASDQTTHDNAIVNNIVRGIGVVNGKEVGPSGTGICIWPGAHHNLIQQNLVPNCLGYGIVVSGTYDNQKRSDTELNIISQNTVSHADDPGICVTSYAKNTVVRKNIVNSCRSAGIVIGNDHDYFVLCSIGTKVLNNTAEENWLEGIYATNNVDGVITGNTLKNNGNGNWAKHVSAGIQIRTDDANIARNNIIVGNVATDDKYSDQCYGIYIENPVAESYVKSNNLVNNKSAGLYNNSRGLNTISNNMTVESENVLKTSPPIADAGNGGCLASGNEGLLDATSSHLMSGRAKFEYKWEQIYGPAVKIKKTSGKKISFIAPKVDKLSIIGVKLTTTNKNGSTSDEVYYAVCPEMDMN